MEILTFRFFSSVTKGIIIIITISTLYLLKYCIIYIARHTTRCRRHHRGGYIRVYFEKFPDTLHCVLRKFRGENNVILLCRMHVYFSRIPTHRTYTYNVHYIRRARVCVYVCVRVYGFIA